MIMGTADENLRGWDLRRLCDCFAGEPDKFGINRHQVRANEDQSRAPIVEDQCPSKEFIMNPLKVLDAVVKPTHLCRKGGHNADSGSSRFQFRLD